MSNTYQASSGERIEKSRIDKKVRFAKEQKINKMTDEYGYLFCEDCGISSGVRLDCSHNIGVDKCQKMHQAELAWDIANITIRCRDCHQKHDKLNLNFKND